MKYKERKIKRTARAEVIETIATYKCKQCGKAMNPVDALVSGANGVCGKCCRENQKKVTGNAQIEARTINVECGKCTDCGGDIEMAGKDYNKLQDCKLCRGKRKVKKASADTKLAPKQPSVKTMMKWMQDGVAKATDGCRVEPDGECPHGCKSWILELGYI